MNRQIILDDLNWPSLPFETDATNPVTGWYNVRTGQMFDKVNHTLSSSPTWTDCVTSISADSSSGLYEDTPDTEMPSGWYIWRLWDSSSPASTDQCAKSKLVYWNQERRVIMCIADL